jgi:hypothetical protein
MTAARAVYHRHAWAYRPGLLRSLWWRLLEALDR